jgi:hypothetical protein
MSLPAARFSVPHVGTARNQGPNPAACADPKVGGLLWGRQLDTGQFVRMMCPIFNAATFRAFLRRLLASANARAPHDRRARQRSISSRKAPGRLPSSACSTVAAAVPATLQPTTGANRAGVEADSALGHSQPLLRHAGGSTQSRQRLLQPLAKPQQSVCIDYAALLKTLCLDRRSRVI